MTENTATMTASARLVKQRAFVSKSYNVEWQKYAAIIPGQDTTWHGRYEDAKALVDKFNRKLNA